MKKKKNDLRQVVFRGATENRTRDTRIFSPLLYQLSYGTERFISKAAAKVLLFFDIRKFFCIFFAKTCIFWYFFVILQPLWN